MKHLWITKRAGGDPAEATSYEWITYCDRCGIEYSEENAMEECSDDVLHASTVSRL